MYAGRLCDAGTLFRSVEDRLYRIGGYMVILLLPIKQPFRGTIFFPVLSQLLKGCLGQNGVTVASFPLSYSYRHPLAIDISHLETRCFA
jgi:hypothetical protein